MKTLTLDTCTSFSIYAGLFWVSITHRTRTWTTWSLTCVCALFAWDEYTHVDGSHGKKIISIDSSFCRIYSNSASCFLCGQSLYICCLKLVKGLWVPRFDQSFGIYRCQKLIWRDCGGQPSDCREEEGELLLLTPVFFYSEGAAVWDLSAC